MQRHLALASLALAAASAPALAAQTWIVDDDPGGHFTSIQAAVNAAQTGDRILVQPGSYGDFWVYKGLTIVGYGTPTAGWAQITDLPAGEVVGLIGFDLGRVTVAEADGVVMLQELSVNSNVTVSNSDDVRASRLFVPGSGTTVHGSRFELNESDLHAADGVNNCSTPNSCNPGGGGSALFSYASRLHLVHSNFQGGKSDDVNCVQTWAGDGGSGISATLGAEVILVGDGAHVARGAAGGMNCYYFPANCSYEGQGGAGITLNGQLWHSGVSLEGASSYVGASCAWVQEPPVRLLGGSATALAVEDPALTLSGTPAAGSPVQFVVHGPQGADVLLYLGRKPLLVSDPSVRIELLTPMNVQWPLGVIDASGAITRSYTIRPLNPGFTFHAQAELTYPGGEVRRTNSIPIVVR